MYKLTRVQSIGTVPYGYEKYRLEEDGKVLHERVTIKRTSKGNTIHGGLFQRDSIVKIPTGQIEIYKSPPTCTQDSIYPIMVIPVGCTAIIEHNRQKCTQNVQPSVVNNGDSNDFKTK